MPCYFCEIMILENQDTCAEVCSVCVIISRRREKKEEQIIFKSHFNNNLSYFKHYASPNIIHVLRDVVVNKLHYI